MKVIEAILNNTPEEAALRFVEIALQRPSNSVNPEKLETWIREMGFTPNNFLSNCILMAVQCINRESHYHMRRVRVLVALLYADHLLCQAYPSKPFTGSTKTGMLSGYRQAKSMLTSVINYETWKMWNEHTKHELQSISLKGYSKEFKCYALLVDLMQNERVELLKHYGLWTQ